MTQSQSQSKPHSIGAFHRSRSYRSRVLAVLALAAAILGTGCVTATSPEIASMKDDIETAVGGDFEREMGIRLGRVSLGLGKAVMGMVARHDDGDMAETTALLRGLRKVEVTVYDTGSFQGGSGQDLPDLVETAMARGRWMPTVRVRSDDELAWVFCRLDEEERLRAVTVVTLDGGQLTLVRLAGRLDRALAAAISLTKQSGGDDRHRDATHEAAGPL
jgi:hypothetical protein